MKKIFAAILVTALIAMMGVTVFAEDLFMPSVEAKVAPEIVPVTDDEGNEAAALLVDAEGNAIGVSADGEGTVLSVVSVADANQASANEVTEKLTGAQEQIKNVNTLADLSAGLGDALADKIASSSDPATSELEVADLVVSQLFDVSLLNGDNVETLPEGASLVFTLQTNLTSGDFFVLLHNVQGSDWEVVENAVLADNGALTVTVDSLSPFALVVDKPANMDVDPDGPDSPQTGVEFNALYAVAAVATVALAVVFFAKAKKSEN